MDHEFELAFNLCDEAAGRIQNQQYGVHRIAFHNHGEHVELTSVHHYTRENGHQLFLFASDVNGQLAVVEATAADLASQPTTRIIKIRAGALTFHALPDQPWTYRARSARTTYTLTATVGAAEPMWLIAVNHGAPTGHHDLDDAVTELLTTNSHVA
ncbi:hypothetical protein [Mycobacterium asiaticum]|uniref:Uncharacterized protein n=1 Tax=Mycobacterium asiaticum TaxID=1790 RepID=A0A1A3KM27_MYCAS|nr:hypothetical protein [Mycobacterium asiaticum]OBJ86080.1 hypothetical protein A5640_11260 [Mycobacterium asiaticum]